MDKQEWRYGRRLREKFFYFFFFTERETAEAKGFASPSTRAHMKRLMMGVCDRVGELLFLGAVKVFTGQQKLIDRNTPPLYKDSS